MKKKDSDLVTRKDLEEFGRSYEDLKLWKSQILEKRKCLGCPWHSCPILCLILSIFGVLT